MTRATARARRWWSVARPESARALCLSTRSGEPHEDASPHGPAARLTIGLANARPSAAVSGTGVREAPLLAGLAKVQGKPGGGADDAVQDRGRRQLHRWSLR